MDMEPEVKRDLVFEASAPDLDSKSGSIAEGVRARGSFRLQYGAQTQVLKQKLGGLEDIRHRLGLSRRKICQLLLVDPSAWTRWTKTDAPPHIYRSLEWYLLLVEKYPGMGNAFWLSTMAERQSKASTDELRSYLSFKKDTQGELEFLRAELEQSKRLLARFYKGAAIMAAVFLTLLGLSFSVRADSNPGHLEIAKKFAPVFQQDVGTNPLADVITNIDFDGDFIANNNWNHLDEFPLKAHVYYDVIETETHYFVVYAAFHVRDYSPTCVWILCHENDLEGLLLTIEKSTQKILLLETMAHNHVTTLKDPPLLVYSSRIKGSHVGVRVEKGKHGIHPLTEWDHQLPLFFFGASSDKVEKLQEDYYSYDLLPLEDIWNKRSDLGKGKLFIDKFDYRGRRFRVSGLAKAFAGEEKSAGKANPPWAWIDLSKKESVRGDWIMDPALWAFERLGKPKNFSLEYKFNRYLDGADRVNTVLQIPFEFIGFQRAKNTPY